MFILDFDNTLYDTFTFVQNFKKVLNSYGITDKQFTESYRASMNWEGNYGFGFSFEKLINNLDKMGFVLDKEEVLKKLTSCIKKDYLFEDAISFLKFANDVDEDVVLLTLGEPEYQRLKVETVGIANYFTDFFYIEEKKEKNTKKISRNKEKIFFINDNLNENKAVSNAVPEIEVITKLNLHKYNEEEAKKAGFPYFSTLTEIKEYVENKLG